MRKWGVTFDWQEMENGQELPALSTLNSAPRMARPGLERPLLIGAAVLLLVAGLVSSAWVVRQAESGQVQIHKELILAAEAEAWVSEDRLRATPPSVSIRRDFAGMDNRAESRGELQRVAAHQDKVISVEVRALQQDMAAVMVFTETRPEDSLAAVGPATVYRQLRFYRRTRHGWQPAEPAPALWGHRQHLATEHFDFTYHSSDAHAVQSVAVELDALYERMRHNFALPHATDGKRTIDVWVGGVDAGWRTPSMPTASIAAPSPALLRAPDFLSDASILRQIILLHLAEQVVQEAASTHSVPRPWYPFLNAVHLWQLWDLDGPLAEWREPVLQWLYVDLWGLGRTDIQLTDANYPLPISIRAETAEYCALHSVWWWQAAAVHQSLPPSCNEVHGTVPALASAAGRHSNRFLDLMRNSSMSDELTEQQGRYESILAAALLDYIAATYGHAQISALWPILQEHNNWGTLIPATFGVSNQEFEAGWQTYLADKMGK